MTLTTSVYQVIQRHTLIPSGSTLVVGVSGGADSLALLHILIALQKRLDFKIHVATLDHGLRGEVGASDAAYVESLCEQWGVPYTRGFADVPALMQAEKLGVEAAARKARYNFLANVASIQGADRVTVAHHADDQAETVLMHLLRGSGLRGIRGMEIIAPMLDRPDLILIRPMLNVSRAEIETYCAEHSIQPRHDATNDDTDYIRNRIRHEILPNLRTVNPQVNRSLGQLAEIISVDDAYIQAQLQAFVDEYVKNDRGGLAIAFSDYAPLHPALKRRLIVWAVERLGSEIDYAHTIQAFDLLAHARVGSIVLFPSNVRLRVDYQEFYIERVHTPIAVLKPIVEGEIQLTVPSMTYLLNGWRFVTTFEKQSDDYLRLALPEDCIIMLRTRRQGDRFAPLGLGGHTQKVSEWMIDHKIPRSWREHVPLLLVNGEIAAVMGISKWAESEHFAVKADSTRVLYCWFETGAVRPEKSGK